MKRAHDARRLDVARFAAEAALLSGEWPGAELPRLAEGQTPPQDLPLAPVRWQVQGERKPVTGGDAQLWLALAAETQVWLTCQRCLQPMAEPLALERRVRFVATEAKAEALDAESEDDVLALPRALDLRELVEDELLLALPLVPRHLQCPQPLPVALGAVDLPPSEGEGDAADDARNPFAVLKGLKRGTEPDGSASGGVL